MAAFCLAAAAAVAAAAADMPPARWGSQVDRDECHDGGHSGDYYDSREDGRRKAEKIRAGQREAVSS